MERISGLGYIQPYSKAKDVATKVYVDEKLSEVKVPLPRLPYLSYLKLGQHNVAGAEDSHPKKVDLSFTVPVSSEVIDASFLDAKIEPMIEEKSSTFGTFKFLAPGKVVIQATIPIEYATEDRPPRDFRLCANDAPISTILTIGTGVRDNLVVHSVIAVEANDEIQLSISFGGELDDGLVDANDGVHIDACAFVLTYYRESTEQS